MLKDEKLPLHPDPRVPLPKALRQRLLKVPEIASMTETSVSCRDIDRLYESTWRQARHGEIDPKARQHLASCEPCHRLYGTLQGAFSHVRLPMPEKLYQRLRGIAGRHRRPPLWVRDGRFAIAASVLLTASLMLLMGDPSPVLRSTTETVTHSRAIWAEHSSADGQAALEAITRTLSTNWQRGREKVNATSDVYREAFPTDIYRKVLSDAVDLYEDNTLRRFIERVQEGENDARP
jgi:hypothetical protein